MKDKISVLTPTPYESETLHGLDTDQGSFVLNLLSISSVRVEVGFVPVKYLG